MPLRNIFNSTRECPFPTDVLAVVVEVQVTQTNWEYRELLLPRVQHKQARSDKTVSFIREMGFRIRFLGVSVQPISSVTARSSGEELKRRVLRVRDKSQMEMEISLWGEQVHPFFAVYILSSSSFFSCLAIGHVLLSSLCHVSLPPSIPLLSCAFHSYLLGWFLPLAFSVASCSVSVFVLLLLRMLPLFPVSLPQVDCITESAPLPQVYGITGVNVRDWRGTRSGSTTKSSQLIAAGAGLLPPEEEATAAEMLQWYKTVRRVRRCNRTCCWFAAS